MTIRSERAGSSNNGNEEREHAAIVAMSRSASAHLRPGQADSSGGQGGISAVLRAPISTRPVGRAHRMSFDSTASDLFDDLPSTEVASYAGKAPSEGKAEEDALSVSAGDVGAYCSSAPLAYAEPRS